MAQFWTFIAERYPTTTWDTVERRHVVEFLEWRRYDAEVTYRGQTRNGASAGTVARNRMALHSFYEHAVDTGRLSANPVPAGDINITRGQVISDVNWVTRRAYLRWRNEGLRGVGSARQDTLLMVDRNTAYADLLYATGMRRSEAAGLLTIEMPTRRVGRTLLKGRVPAALSKNRPVKGRAFYIDDDTKTKIQDYIDNGRGAEVAHGIRSGRYEAVTDALIAIEVQAQGGVAHSVRLRDMSVGGEERTVLLDDLTAKERARVFAINTDGMREPLYLWLGHGGHPFGSGSWNGVFAAANQRMATSHVIEHHGLQLREVGGIELHPHMLRHSFALYIFAVATLTELQRRGEANAIGLRRYVEEYNAWTKVQNLLGHKDVSTTRGTYLAPVQALEWDWFAASVADAPVRLDALLSAVADVDSRVIDVEGDSP